MKNHSKATRCFEKAYSLSPKSKEVGSALADQYVEEGKNYSVAAPTLSVATMPALVIAFTVLSPLFLYRRYICYISTYSWFRRRITMGCDVTMLQV